MDRYAVMGNPIAHSKSPMIHSEFAKQTGQQLQYTAELVAIGNLPQAVLEFYRDGGKGLNITVPFKQDAYALVSELSPRAQRAGAVNTLVLNGEQNYFGDTTDGVGLARDLGCNHCIDMQQRRMLILGAGGAVRGVLEPLLQEQPHSLVIANRTIEKAQQLANDFSDLGDIAARGFQQLAGQRFDIVINGTSASLTGDLPPLPDGILNDGATVYDMMYGAQPTPFMQWGKQQGAGLCLDGLGMLVEQAAESFYIWRKQHPDTAPVIEKIRAMLRA